MGFPCVSSLQPQGPFEAAGESNLPSPLHDWNSGSKGVLCVVFAPLQCDASLYPFLNHNVVTRFEAFIAEALGTHTLQGAHTSRGVVGDGGQQMQQYPRGQSANFPHKVLANNLGLQGIRGRQVGV